MTTTTTAAFVPTSGWQQRRTSSLLQAYDDYLLKVREGLNEAGLEMAWRTAIDTIVTETKTTTTKEIAEDALATALNWKRWAIVTLPSARKYIRVLPIPTRQELQDNIEWFRTGPLQVPDNFAWDVALTTCPAAYLLTPVETYQQALAAAPFDDPGQFRDILWQDPSVLQCTYNCADTGCASECGNCWVSFQTASSVAF